MQEGTEVGLEESSVCVRHHLFNVVAAQVEYGCGKRHITCEHIVSHLFSHYVVND